ncbi:MAG: DUF3048 domain-containing protein [Acidimicrobiia bacterium]|nr:DUF3048 domain-containing protein [Acidimicrobiia bacterium]NNJ48441.1 DUF3048 domain-containing protein [Acidimicrobiia bacterium]
MTLTTPSVLVPDSTTTTAVPPTTTTTTVPATTTTIDPGPPAPLTGLTGDVSDQRVLIAKLSNAAKGRPQAGINEADLVMEILVEGGVGRWLAVFQTTYPATVGPVRSLREVDPRLVAPFDARVLSSGGQWSIRVALGEVAVDEGDGRIDGYRRESGREYVYSLMYDTENLPEVEWDGEVAPVLDFDISTPAGGDDATEIEVRMSARNDLTWTFDHGRYFRAQDGEESLDADGLHISADSVVVVWVETIDTGRVDAAGSAVPDYEVTGSGEAIVFRDGKAFAARWQRPQEADFFSFADLNGNQIPLSPGRTWLHITPSTGSVDWS